MPPDNQYDEIVIHAAYHKPKEFTLDSAIYNTAITLVHDCSVQHAIRTKNHETTVTICIREVTSMEIQLCTKCSSRQAFQRRMVLLKIKHKTNNNHIRTCTAYNQLIYLTRCIL